MNQNKKNHNGFKSQLQKLQRTIHGFKAINKDINKKATNQSISIVQLLQKTNKATLFLNLKIICKTNKSQNRVMRVISIKQQTQNFKNQK